MRNKHIYLGSQTEFLNKSIGSVTTGPIPIDPLVHEAERDDFKLMGSKILPFTGVEAIVSEIVELMEYGRCELQV